MNLRTYKLHERGSLRNFPESYVYFKLITAICQTKRNKNSKKFKKSYFYGKKISSTASTYSAYYPLRNVTLVSVEVYSDFEKLAAVGTVGSCISLLVNL